MHTFFKKYVYEDKLYFLVGFVSLLGVLKQSEIIGLFLKIPLFLIAIYFILNAFLKKCIYINAMTLVYGSIFLAIIVGPEDFLNENYEAFKYVTPYYIFISFFLNPPEKFLYYFEEGAKIAIKFNIIFSFFVFCWWLFYGADIATQLLEDILKINSGDHTFFNIYNFTGIDILRIAGFSWDPMHIGLVSVIGYILFKASKNWFWVFASLLTLLLSGSRAGLVALLAVFVYEFFNGAMGAGKKFSLFFFLSIFFAFLIWISFTRDFEATGNIKRIAYYIYGPISLIYGGLVEFVFGGAPYSTGNTLINKIWLIPDNNIFTNALINDLSPNQPWNIEPDIVSILVGRGMLGVLIWILVNYYCYKRSISTSRNLFIALFSLTLGYSYSFSIFYQFMLLFYSPKLKLTFTSMKSYR